MRPVSIHFFAHLKEVVGHSRVVLNLDSDCTVKQFIARMEEVFPSTKNLPKDGRIKIAVNQEIINDDGIIHPGDDVAFLPPFSGG